MKQIDIFSDDEFQSLDLTQKQTITSNYFDTELADDEFSTLDTQTQKKIKDNFINAQLDFDVSDTVDKFTDSFGEIPTEKMSNAIAYGYDRTTDALGSLLDSKPEEEVQTPAPTEVPSVVDASMPEQGAVTDPALHNAVAPNPDGTIPDMPKQEAKRDTTLLEDIQNIVLGSGEEYENPDAQEYEVGKRVVNRTNELTSNAIQSTYNFLGNIKSPIEYLGFEPEFMRENNKVRAEWFEQASDSLNDFIFEKNKLDVKPTHTWDETKKAFKAGGVFDVDSWQELLNYGASEGIASLPDMAEMVAAMPLYYAARQQESAEKRAKNEGRVKPTKADYFATAPTVMGSLMLDRLGLKGMTEDVATSVGKKALDGSMQDVVKTIGKEMLKGGFKEGLTEGLQNPLEKFGEEVGTKTGLSSGATYLDEAVAGFVAGKVMGVGMSGTTATGAEVFKSYSKNKQEKQREAFIADALKNQMMDNALVMRTNDVEFQNFKDDLDAKVSTIQSEFTNLVINNPDMEVPVEAVDDIAAQAAIVLDAKEQGLDTSSQDGLNAIDAGFKELEEEIGTTDEDLTPFASEDQEQNDVIDTIEPEATVEELLAQKQAMELDARLNGIDLTQEIQAIDAQLQDKGVDAQFDDAQALSEVQDSLSNTQDKARLEELSAIPDDELSIDDRFELEDLQEKLNAVPESMDLSDINLGDKNKGQIQTTTPQTKEPTEEDIETIPVDEPMYDFGHVIEKNGKLYKLAGLGGSGVHHFSEINGRGAEYIRVEDIEALSVPVDDVVDTGDKETLDIEFENDNYKIYSDGSVLRVREDGTVTDFQLDKEKDAMVRASASYDGAIPEYKYNDFQKADVASSDTQAWYYAREANYRAYVDKVISGELPKNEATTIALNEKAIDLERRAKKLNITREIYKNENELREFTDLDRELAEKYEDGAKSRADANAKRRSDADVQATTQNSTDKRGSTSDNDVSSGGQARKAIVFDTSKYYSTKGIMAEYPNQQVAKKIQKDVAKYVGQLADRLGYDFALDAKGKKQSWNGVNANLPPAGGNMTFKLFKPESDIGIYVSLSYDLDFETDPNNDGYSLGDGIVGGHLFRTTSKDGKDGRNNFVPTHKLTSDEFIDDISYEVEERIKKESTIIDKEGKDNGSDTRENSSSRDTEQTDNELGVPAEQQSTPEPKTNQGSDSTVSKSDRRPNGPSENGSTSDEVSDGYGGVGGYESTSTNQSNESKPTDTDTVLPRADELDSPENYSLEGKTPVALTKGQRKKFNAESLEILKKPIEDITEADREILRHYTGAGGLDEVSVNSINQHYTSYETVEAMTKALSDAGIPMTKVLEPAVGSGNFVGFNPDASWDVVDIDTTNIEVTKRLYPQIKNFHAETYETFQGKNYDLIISNVPFASEQMLMREHALTIKPAFKAIHNFYFAHSMDKVKDNGVVAFMTSTGTMDGTTQARVLRSYLMDRGDIIGAYRLPEKSQAKNAHTDTMIDIIFIQKRPAGVESRQKDVNNQFVNIGNKDGFPMNEYFIAHPENLLGDTVVVDKDKTKMGKEAWIVRGEPKLENIKLTYEPYKKLKKSKEDKNSFVSLEEAREYAKDNGLVFKTVDDMKTHSVIESDSFTLFDKELRFEETDQGAMFGTPLKGANANKALHLNRIMTLTEDAIAQNNDGLLQTALREIESYKETYEKSPHKDLALKKFMKQNRADVKLKEFMSYFDADFTPAPIYGEQTRFKDSGKIEISKDSTLVDKALFYSNANHEIDTSKAYEFLSASEIAQLQERGLYVKSAPNTIELEFMYYAGNVYKKLDNLENLQATGDISKEAYNKQYKALKEIIPAPIPFKNIKVKGRESWLPDAVKNLLLKTLSQELQVNPIVFDNKYTHVDLYNRYLNKTALAPKKKDESDAENIQRTMEAEKLLNEVLVPQVMKYIEENNLAEILTDEYNRHANFYVRPEMRGVLLRDMPKSFRGKAFKMQSHQAEGAEKIVFNKKGVLAFAPGGGKTITAVVAVKNLLEQGVMKKPLFVVPVNTIAQWEETIKELYPDASVFEFPKVKSGPNKGNAKEWSQLSKDEKEQMAFDLANNRYDFTIIGDTMFQKFGLPREVLSDYVDDLVNQMVKAEDAEADTSSKKKQKELVSAEQKKKALKIGLQQAYKGDVEFDFEKLGFDGLIADEVQYYKNIGLQGSDAKGGLGATLSLSYYDRNGKSITSKDIKQGAEPYSATIGSMRSYDFRFKSKYVSQNNNGNNVILLTGTPTPNKPLELYTLLQHLDENILKEYGIEASSDFVDTFYDIENYETTDSTGKIVKREGLGSMKNLSWLQKILDRYVDYKGFKDMPDLPRPKQVDVEHYLQLSKAGEAIFQDVQYRIIKAIEDSKAVKQGQMRPENAEIALAVMGAGRSASIDLRLYDVGSKGKSLFDPDALAELIEEDIATTENNKILKTVELVNKQYKENSNSGQIIFLDRLTVKNPDGSTTSTHEEIRDKVLKSGLFNENEVVFVNGSGYVNPTTGNVVKGSIKPTMLNTIMDKYNAGEIKVIIGNTPKLGVGVDLNKKTTDIYQLDIPYRPDEIEQRNNRGVRQGNENAEVRVHNFFQIGTFDKRSYEIVLAKRGFNDIYGFTDNETIEGVDGVSIIDNKNTTDPYQAIIDLEKDPFVREKLRKQRAIDNAVVDANDLKNIVEKLQANINTKLGSIKNYEDGMKSIDENLQPKNYPEYKNIKDEAEKKEKLDKHIQGLQERKAKYAQTIKDIQEEIAGYETTLTERKAQQEEHAAETKFITDEFTYDGANVDVELIKKVYTEQQILESEETTADDGKDSAMSVPAKQATQKLTTPKPKKISKAEEKAQDETNSFARAHGYDEAGVNYIPTYATTGVPARPTDDKITIGTREVELPTLEQAMNADSVRVYVSDIIGNRLYEAKIQGKSALGVYKRADSAIRVQNYSDMEVLAHEMAHYLDFFHKNKSKAAKDSFFRREILKNKDEVKALSYTTDPKKVIKEGFAEFVRLWLTNYNALNLVAPNMVKDFEAKLAKDKELQTKMIQLQDGMHQYYFQGVEAMARSKRGGELNTTAKKIKRSQREIAKDIRQSVIDRVHSIKRIEADIRGDVAADAIDSPYKALQMVNGASSVMYSAMNVGVPTVLDNGDISYSGKSLNDIFNPATSVSEERVKLLEDYLVAKRASELMEQGRENLLTADEIETGLALAQKYPEFEDVFNEYQEFNDAMLDFYVDMKLITTDQRANFKEMNQNYVPFHRITESVQYGDVPPATIGQRLTGGTRSLGNIMENIIEGVESNIKQALISRGKSMFYEMLEQSDMGGVYATKVATDTKLVKDDLDAQASKVATIMAMLGMTITKDGMVLSGKSDAENFYDVEEIKMNLLANPKTLDVWTHGHPPTSIDGYIDSVIINDKKVYFETKDKGLVDAMTSFGATHHNAAMQGLMSVKNIMTWNITNNPLFYLTNFARDTVSASVLSKNGFVPVISSINGMYHFIMKTKTYKEFMASGSGYGTRSRALGSEAQAMQMLNVQRRGLKRSFAVLERLLAALAYGADVFEYGTRVGDFALARKKGKSMGQAAFESREISTDFAIKGSNTSISAFMATVPFMKAGLLGIDKTARRIFSLNGEMKFSNAVKFKNQLGELQGHKVKLYVTGGLIATASLALWLSNKDDERYKKLTRDSKMMYWHFFVGDTHYKIPRPYDIGFAFATLPEIIADGIYTKHGEDALKDFMWGVKNMFSIGDVSGMFQPILDDMTNTNWTGAPIVPTNLQNLDDLSDQYFATTPLLYKELGELTGASPIKTQHYVDGYLGLTAKMVEEATEKMLWNTKEWGARPFEKNALEFMTYRFRGKEVDTRTKYSEKYYELMQKATSVKNSFEKKKREAVVDKGADVTAYMSDKEKQAYVNVSSMMRKYGKILTNIKNDVEMIKYDKSKTKKAKESEINKAYTIRTDMFKDVSENIQKAIDELEETDGR